MDAYLSELRDLLEVVFRLFYRMHPEVLLSYSYQIPASLTFPPQDWLQDVSFSELNAMRLAVADTLRMYLRRWRMPLPDVALAADSADARFAAGDAGPALIL